MRVSKYKGGCGYGKPVQVEVPEGGVAQVTLADSGRRVIGCLKLSEKIPAYDWNTDLQHLEEVREDLPRLKLVQPDSQEFPRWLREYMRRDRQIRKLYPVIQPEGKFQLDDVPPGRYAFKIKVTSPLPEDEFGGQVLYRPELGSCELEVQVQAGDLNDSPVDLGTIMVPVTAP